jgi:hypothetical protein
VMDLRAEGRQAEYGTLGSSTTADVAWVLSVHEIHTGFQARIQDLGIADGWEDWGGVFTPFSTLGG